MAEPQPEGRKQTSGGSERKSEVTLKTIGPLPGHTAVLRASPPPPQPSPVLFPPCLVQLCLEADGGDKDECRP